MAPQPKPTRGCMHAVLELVKKGDRTLAICVPCRRVWNVREEEE